MASVTLGAFFPSLALGFLIFKMKYSLWISWVVGSDNKSACSVSQPCQTCDRSSPCTNWIVRIVGYRSRPHLDFENHGVSQNEPYALGTLKRPALSCHSPAETLLMFPRHFKEQKSKVLQRNIGLQVLRGLDVSILQPQLPWSTSQSHHLQLQWLLFVPWIYKACWQGLCTSLTWSAFP